MVCSKTNNTMNLYQFKKDEYAFFENILFAFSNDKRISLQEAKSIFDIYIYLSILYMGFDLSYYQRTIHTTKTFRTSFQCKSICFNWTKLKWMRVKRGGRLISFWKDWNVTLLLNDLERILTCNYQLNWKVVR